MNETTEITAIALLHPTQITVGWREVEQKRLKWRRRNSHLRQGVADVPVIPVVRGPKDQLYIVDRHHLLCALRAEGIEAVATQEIINYSTSSIGDFWISLDKDGGCHPYDNAGRRRPFHEIPPTVDGLTNDIYRSLASALRKAGGFNKTPTPFSEFAWADFLRDQISEPLVLADFGHAMSLALCLAGKSSAAHLPGWRPSLAVEP